MEDLNKRALAGLARIAIGLAVLLFLPAGTVDYWQGWIFLAVFSASALAITVHLMKNDPKLLQRRMRAGPGAEKERRFARQSARRRKDFHPGGLRNGVRSVRTGNRG